MSVLTADDGEWKEEEQGGGREKSHSVAPVRFGWGRFEFTHTITRSHTIPLGGSPRMKNPHKGGLRIRVVAADSWLDDEFRLERHGLGQVVIVG